MKGKYLGIILLLTATLTAIPLTIAVPSTTAASTKHFFLRQMNSTFGSNHCGGGSNTLCFNDTVPGPTITVNQGDTVSITVNNTDLTSHTFTLSGAYSTQTLTNSPGQSQSIQFTASTATPGTQYMCTFPSHSSFGMHGTFVVKATASTPISPVALVGLILTAATSVYVIGRRRR